MTASLFERKDPFPVCGIAGIWGSSDGDVVERLMSGIVHRGPDGSGMHVQSNGVLGHRRLAIMDPAGGMQPLYDETAMAAIVANGEICNFPALRHALGDRQTFATTWDL